MNFPENIFYTEDHEWIKFHDKSAYVGVTDFAQKELGDIVYVEIDTIGQTMQQNEVFGTIEAVKTVSDLFLPVDGEILEINQQIIDSPELVNSDPYDEGWLVKMIPVDASNRENLLSSDAYKRLVGFEI